jgi:PAS domain S-box-containing protein
MPLNKSSTHIAAIKNSMLDKLLIIISLAGIPSLIVVYFNAKGQGRFPYISMIGTSLIVLSAIFRKKIKFGYKAYLVILLGFLIAVQGLRHEGLLSDAIIYFIFITMLASMLISIRTGFIVMIASLVTMGYFTFLISTGRMKYQIDIVRYFYSPVTWLGFVAITILFTAMVIFIYEQLERYLMQYVEELTVKTNRLNDSNILLAREIEERHLAEQQLAQSEIKIRNVFNMISDGIILMNQQYFILDVNEGVVKMTGFKKDLLLGKNIESLFAEPEKLHEMLDPEMPKSLLFKKNELLVKTSEKNVTIPVETRILEFPEDPAISFIMMLKNIANERENEKKIMNAVITREEEERMRIAQELHDGVGPYLSAARMYLQSIDLPDEDQKAIRIKKELSELMNISINSIREISGNLGSHTLRSMGLKASLADYIRKINASGQVVFELNLPDRFPFLENVELALYRVFTELIHNSMKYGSPAKISISLTDSPAKVHLKYRENGVGFNLQEALAAQRGMGLYNIHTRIQSLDGSIDFQSRPGKGVWVNINFDRIAACKIV